VEAGEREPFVDDPALPGGSLLLTWPRLEQWLGESLGRTCTVWPRRLRHKPGTSVVLGFLLTTVGADGMTTSEPCVVSAWAPHAAAKLAKSWERLAPEACLAHDPDRLVLATRLAGDRALPLLPRLGRPDGLSRVLDGLAPEETDAATARTRTLRHNPGRRWVGLLEREQHTPLLLRAYGSADRMVRAAEVYRALGPTAPRTPDLVATSHRLAALSVTWADGSDLASTGDRRAWHAAGAALARLHDSGAGALPPTDPRPGTDAVQRAGSQLAVLLPEVADEVRDLTRATTLALEHLPRDRVVLHGDFSPDQVVITGDGSPVLIDLDSAHLGPSAYDLGCLTASTLLEAEADGYPTRGLRDLTTFLGGYDTVRARPDAAAVDVHAVAFRLRKAIDPFRECAPDWRTQVVDRVAGARAALDEASLTGV
jgi:aminoglycoside phosphotransferase (APT) family kinase protein